MPIYTKDGVATSFVGPESVNLFRVMTMVRGLRAELRGMRLSRGISCYAMAKKEFGLRGNKEKVLAQLEAVLENMKAHAEIVEETLKHD